MQSKNWTVPCFERCIDHIDEANRLLHLCMQGLSQITNLPRLAKALADLGRFDAPLSSAKESELAETEARAKFAQEEIEKGFPVLHAHTTIALWSTLEALVEDLATVWLLNEPSTLERDQFAKIKIPLAEYHRLDDQDRMILMVKELTRSTNADLKLGIRRFEIILESLGLSGAVDENVRRALFELSQVRNVLVHRAGIVDRRFKETCPWIDIEVGSKLQIDHQTYSGYRRAVQDYVLSLINRVRLHFGIEAYPALSEKDASSEDGNA